MKLCLVQHGFNASELSPAKDLLVWHMALPADTENFAKAAQVELHGPVSWYAAGSKSKSRSRTGETVAQQLGIRSAWS